MVAFSKDTTEDAGNPGNSGNPGNVGAASPVERLAIIEYALYSCNLLEEKYYSRVGYALVMQKKDLFDAVCKEANIPEKYWDALWKIFDAGPKDLNRMW